MRFMGWLHLCFSYSGFSRDRFEVDVNEMFCPPFVKETKSQKLAYHHYHENRISLMRFSWYIFAFLEENLLAKHKNLHQIVEMIS
jgi:hypothetical protein